MYGLVIKSSPKPSYSSIILVVAGKVSADLTTPALAASDLSVPVFTPLVVEFDSEVLVPILNILPRFLLRLKLTLIFLNPEV